MTDFIGIHTILQGHESEESAYIVNDYPYGSFRTQKRYWLEASTQKRRFGDAGDKRMVEQTLDPKKNQWNKPHKDRYYTGLTLLILDDENQHVHVWSVDHTADASKIKYLKNFWNELTHEQQEQLTEIEKTNRADSPEKWIDDTPENLKAYQVALEKVDNSASISLEEEDGVKYYLLKWGEGYSSKHLCLGDAAHKILNRFELSAYDVLWDVVLEELETKILAALKEHEHLGFHDLHSLVMPEIPLAKDLDAKKRHPLFKACKQLREQKKVVTVRVGSGIVMTLPKPPSFEDYVIAVTAAPEDYDSFGTQTVEWLGCTATNSRGDRYRKVAILPEHYKYHEGRYLSGMYSLHSLEEFDKLKDILPAYIDPNAEVQVQVEQSQEKVSQQVLQELQETEKTEKKVGGEPSAESEASDSLPTTTERTTEAEEPVPEAFPDFSTTYAITVDGWLLNYGEFNIDEEVLNSQEKVLEAALAIFDGKEDVSWKILEQDDDGVRAIVE